MTYTEAKEMKKTLIEGIRMAHKDFMIIVEEYEDADLIGIQRYGFVMLGRMDMCIELLDKHELITKNSINLLNGFRERFRKSLRELEVL